MRRLLIRAVLAIYPPAVRERYGDEIAGLLAASATPGRDLADTAWCALRDRVAHRTGTMTVTKARTTGFVLLKLLVAPAVFGVVTVTTIMVGAVAAETAGLHEVADTGYVMALPVIGPLVWLWGRAAGRGEAIGAATVVVPVALALGVAAVAAAPYIGEVVGENRAAALTTIACWCLGAIGLAAAVRALLGRRRTVAAWLTGAAGGLLLMEAATAAYVLTAFPAHAAPRHLAPLWYPATMVNAWDQGLVWEAHRYLEDAMKALPAVLTLCTVFTLAVAGVTASRVRRVASSA
ncbi:hypothetical protein [Catellatospora sp. NPDC049609]|uniref:hypothetical protein n=1 Tax=Catellatospora sp. NPDC049609 TaxID=3155505 RepID=UPI00343B858E